MGQVSADDAISILQEAWESGRSIVPLLGAGVSVEAGIPTLSALVLYLAKTRFYIQNRVFAPRPYIEPVKPSSDGDSSAFLREIGWPDPNQLTADLWQWFNFDARLAETDNRDQMGIMIQRVLLEELKGEESRFVRFIEQLRKNAGNNADKSTLETALRESMGAKWDKGMQWEAYETLLKEELWQLKGDWKSLLGNLSGGDPDYADFLFRRLTRGKQPGTSHRFIALLTKLMEWRLILTTNFDTLIEDALRNEGLNPVVYDVIQSAPLPHPKLVKEDLSIVKLHGSAYGLRIGEQLDYPLDLETKKRFRQCLPDDVILLVLGCGGADRRVRNLVEAMIDENKQSNRGDHPSVLWIHFERELPEPVGIDLAARFHKAAFVGSYHRDPAGFLVELASRLTRSHPVSRSEYIVRPGRPTMTDAAQLAGGIPAIEAESAANIHALPNETIDRIKQCLGDIDRRARFQVFTTIRPDETSHPAPVRPPTKLSSLSMSTFVSEMSESHTPIWVDLESIYTVGALIVEIIGQCRTHDTSLSPLVLPTGSARDPADRYADTVKGVRRIFAALRRGRYILALDNIGFFGRPQTVHHGLAFSETDNPVGRIKQLHEFLLALAHIPQDPAQSKLRNPVFERQRRVILAQNGFRTDQRDGEKQNPEAAKLVEWLKRDYRKGLRAELKDSFICLAIDEPTHRYREGCTESQRQQAHDVLMHVRRLRSAFAAKADDNGPLIHVVDCPSDFKFPNTSATAAENQPQFIRQLPEGLLVAKQSTASNRHTIKLSKDGTTLDVATYWRILMFLSAFRRPRSIVGLVKLLSPLLPADCQLDTLLAFLVKHGMMRRGDGGFFWLEPRFHDEVYEAISELTSPDEINDACRAEAKQKHVVTAFVQLLFLVRHHQLISRYYYADVYLSTHDMNAFFEYWYHRVSALRYSAKLATLLSAKRSLIQKFFAHGEAPLILGDDEEELFADVLYGPLRIHLDRLNDLRALRRAMNRDRDELLQRVPADTFLGWIHWVIRDDCEKFRWKTIRNRINLGMLSHPRWPLPSTPREFSNPEEFRKRIREIELECNREVDELVVTLGRFETTVLRDKTDFRQCIETRVAEIKRLISAVQDRERAGRDQRLRWLRPDCTTDKLLDELTADRQLNDVSRCLINLIEPATEKGKENPEKARQFIEAMIDIAACLKSWGGHRNRQRAAALLGTAKALVEGIENKQRPWRHLFKPQQLELLFRSADLKLSNINGWYMKGAMLDARDRMQKKCDDVIATCNAGLELVRETDMKNHKDYCRYRCFFHTLIGRASFLKRDFPQAHRSLDEAKAGLESSVSSHRVARAVSELYLAECLMIESDHVLESSNLSLLNIETVSREHLNEEGRLALQYADFFQERRHLIREVRHPLARKELELALTVWVLYAVRGVAHGALKTWELDQYERCRERLLELNRSEGDREAKVEAAKCLLVLGEWEAKYAPEEVSKQLYAEDSSSAESCLIRSTLQQCTSNWSDELLRRIRNAEDQELITQNIRKATQRLSRAEGVLDRVQTLLESGKKNVYWWRLLYTLRAQLHVESLLTIVSGGPPPDWENRSRVFNAGLAQRLRQGLQAIRDGLDNLLCNDQFDESPEGINAHETWLLRIWIELMVVAMSVVIVRRDEIGDRKTSRTRIEDLWFNWEWANRAAGLQDLLVANGFFRDYLERVLSRFPRGCGYSMMARSYTLRCVKECIRLGGLAHLQQALRSSNADLGATATVQHRTRRTSEKNASTAKDAKRNKTRSKK